MSQTLEEIQDYWTRRASGFSEAVTEEMSNSSGHRWRAFFCEIFPEPCRILDLGAGAGFFTMILASLGHDVTAVDYSIGMLEKIKENIGKADVTAKIFRMDAQNLDFQNESFDAVVSRNVFWNLEKPEQAYNEVFRVLKPGGTLVIVDGNFYLHHHNEKYAKAREAFKAKVLQRERSNGHVRFNRGEVDFSVIENIAAKKLPLSRIERPVWDFRVLTEVGFRDIHVTIHGNELPMGFKIIAKKTEAKNRKLAAPVR